MLTKAFLGEIDIILVKSISRFSRNLLDMLRIIQELRDKGVEVIFEKENISSLDTKCDNYLTLYAKFAEEELVSMGKNVKWSIEKRYRDGDFYMNANMVFGFKFDEKRNIVIDETAARWVRFIFKRYIAGESSSEICDELMDAQVVSITGKRVWTQSMLRHIIKNEKYFGTIILHKTYSKDSVSQKIVVNHGEKDKIIIENAIPKIVSKETFLEANRLMDERAEKYRSCTRRKEKTISLFTGFAYCPYCRKPYHRKLNKGVEMLYCSSNRERSLCKESESIFVEHLKYIIPLLVKKLKANEKELREELEKTFKDEHSESNKTRIKELEDEIEKTRANYLSYEGLDGEAFIAIKNELKGRLHILSSEKCFLENESLKSIDPKVRANEIIKALHEFPNEEKLGDYNFRNLFKRVIVIKRNRLVFVLGNEDLSELPYNPQSIPMKFIESYRYKVRATWSNCYFGIYINR